MIDWVMRAEGVSFRHAVELLSATIFRYGERRDRRRRNRTVPKLPPLIEHTADDSKLLEIVVSYYHETLKQIAGGAAVSGEARPAIGGDGRALPAGLRQPHARLPSAGIEPRSPARSYADA